MSGTSPECLNTNGNTQLANACACEKAANDLSNSFTIYQANVNTYNTNAANYNTAWEKYQSDLSTWNTNRQNQKNTLLNENRDSGCGACGTEQGCPSGWVDNGRFGCGLWNTLCNHHCKRSDNQAEIDLGPWLSQNPKPSPPPGGTNGTVTPCSDCNPPSGNNVLCCSQLFSNITGNTNFSDIQQQCNQIIKQQITDAVTPTVTPNQASPVVTPTVTQTTPFFTTNINQVNKIEIIVLIVIVLLILLLILF
jgi:hypothetical protein